LGGVKKKEKVRIYYQTPASVQTTLRILGIKVDVTIEQNLYYRRITALERVVTGILV
jgi:hypothetical protein